MAMLELTVHHQLANGLNLFSSRLGPIVCGKSGSSLIKQNNQAHSAISASSVRQDEELAEQMKKFFASETGGFNEHAINEDELAEMEFQKSVKLDAQSGRYEVGLPWKLPPEVLRCN